MTLAFVVKTGIFIIIFIDVRVIDTCMYGHVFEKGNLSNISLNHDLVTELDRIRVFDVIALLKEVSIGHLQRMRLANRGRLLLRTLWDLHLVLC